MPGSGPSVSVIIPTMNRQKDLERCVRSLLAQSRLPEELVVVDDGDLQPEEISGLLDGHPIRFVYVKKDRKGLARSRNVGIRHSTGDVLVFLDDDTELDVDYLRGYLSILESDTEQRIGGLSGTPTRYVHGVEVPTRTPLTVPVMLSHFFLLADQRGGRVLPSGFRSPMVDPGDLTDVDFLQGGNMALRRKVLDEFSFDEELDRSGGYSLGEDVFFSYPVGRKYALYSTRRARLKHFATPGNRPNRRDLNRMKVIHQYRFVRKTMNGGVMNLAAFGWSMIGLVVINSLVFLRRPERNRWSNLEGILSGIAHVIRHPSGDHVV
ncbi:MAG TPA: glycosyltransferase family 2 protein [Candidatus Polarisedimenticolaceae bacterium]|nr:glycosyltransferase family 2 protein [Candidatus Polarisedimenticolaceae bacterium]